MNATTSQRLLFCVGVGSGIDEVWATNWSVFPLFMALRILNMIIAIYSNEYGRLETESDLLFQRDTWLR